MYWRQSIPLFGGLKYNKTSNGKDYISYRKNGIYIREPVDDIKNDIKSLFSHKKKIELADVQKSIKNAFISYNDAEIFKQVELLKQFNVLDDDIANIVASSIFDGSNFLPEQLNHAKGIFTQIKCSTKKKKEINSFINDELNRINSQNFPQQQNFLNPPIQNIQANQTQNSATNFSKKITQNSNSFETAVEIFRENNGTFNKVTNGFCKVENGQVFIKANVTKSFKILEINEIYKNDGKLFIYIKSREQAFIFSSNEINELFDFIKNEISKNKI